MHLAPHFDLKQRGLPQTELFRDQRDPRGEGTGDQPRAAQAGLLTQRRAGGAWGAEGRVGRRGSPPGRTTPEACLQLHEEALWSVGTAWGWALTALHSTEHGWLSWAGQTEKLRPVEWADLFGKVASSPYWRPGDGQHVCYTAIEVSGVDQVTWE